jgi:hypothetical protein
MSWVSWRQLAPLGPEDGDDLPDSRLDERNWSGDLENSESFPINPHPSRANTTVTNQQRRNQ